ncbi:MAG: hypothetical protein WC959_07470 [Kiritimatiellales bacterium]
MKRVTITKKAEGFAVVEISTGKVVFRANTRKECSTFLMNQREYGYSPVFKKGQHYAV